MWSGRLAIVMSAALWSNLSWSDESNLSNASAEMVRNCRSITELQSVIAKQQTQITELSTQLNGLVGGQLRIANLRVGKISLDGGAIDTNAQNMQITHSNGASILLHTDRVWLRAPTGHTLHLQTDGNLVLDNPTPKTIWHTATHGR
jgi:hypothetical protein